MNLSSKYSFLFILHLLFSVDGMVYAQNVEMHIQTRQKSAVGSLAFSNDGKWLASAGVRQIQIWHDVRRKLLYRISVSGTPHGLLWLSDTLLAYDDQLGNLCVLDVHQQKLVCSYPVKSQKFSFAWVPNRHSVYLAGGDRVVRRLVLQDDSIVQTDSFGMMQIEGGLNLLAHHSGDTLLFATDKSEAGMVNIGDKSILRIHRVSGPVLSVQLLADKQVLFVLTPAEVNAIDCKGRHTRNRTLYGSRYFGSNGGKLTFRQALKDPSGKGLFVSSLDNYLYYFNHRVQRRLLRYSQTGTEQMDDSGVMSMAVHPVSGVLVTGDNHGKIQCFSSELKPLGEFSIFPDYLIQQVSFNGEGNKLLLSSGVFLNVMNFRGVFRYNSFLDGELSGRYYDRRYIQSFVPLGADSAICSNTGRLRYWDLSAGRVFYSKKVRDIRGFKAFIGLFGGSMVATGSLIVLPIGATVLFATTNHLNNITRFESRNGGEIIGNSEFRFYKINGKSMQTFGKGLDAGKYAFSTTGNCFARLNTSGLHVYPGGRKTSRKESWRVPQDTFRVFVKNGSYVETVAIKDFHWHPAAPQIVTENGDHSMKVFDWNMRNRVAVFSGEGKGFFDATRQRFWYLKDKNTLVFRNWNTWELPADSTIQNYAGTSPVVSFALHSHLSRLVVVYEDGSVKFWDTDSARLLAEMYTPGRNEYIIKTPDQYFMASENALNFVSFTQDGRYFPLQQYELRYHRPDIVLARLGFTDEETVALYRAAFLKRLRQYHISEESLQGELELPNIRLVNESALKPENGRVYLEIKAGDRRYRLHSVHVLVNGVPVFGEDGLLVIRDSLKEYHGRLAVALQTGKNVIRCFVINEKGSESLSETLELMNNDQPAEPQLIVVSVGVSRYRDSRWNLLYAAKDAGDVAAEFRSRYRNVKVIALTDSMAVRENILAIRNRYLMNTRTDDRVIVSFSGHGMVDDKLDFWFAGWDMDFDHPAARGISYGEMMFLLDSIPARNKLLLVDACHSGAMDKDVEYVSSSAVAAYQRGAGTQTASSGVQEYELMEQVFPRTGRNNGATVVSASAGTQFAFEGKDWKNGVFTYSLLEGIRSGKADLNRDKAISMSELRDYMSQRVLEYTQGRQRPTTRQVNLENNWSLKRK